MIRSVGLVACLALAAPALAQDDFISSESLAPAALVKYWQLQLPLEADQTLVDAFLVDDVLYLTTQDGYAFAVHAYTGAIRWLREITSGGYRVRAPCHAGDRAVFVTPTRLVAFDRVSGESRLDVTLGIPAGSAGASDGALVFFGSLNERFYAFDALDGLERWKITTNGPIDATPAVFEGAVYLASDDGGVYSCTAADKRFRWQAVTNGPNTADLVVDTNGVYVASRDQSLYLFDLAFGQPRWRVRFAGPLYEPPAVTADTAYQFCPDDGLWAVNVDVLEADDRIRWKMPNGRALATVHKDTAFVYTRDRTLQSVDAKTGDIRHTVPTQQFSLVAPSPREPAVYLATSDGRVFCARPKGARPPRREDLRAAVGIAPPASQPASAPAAAATRKPQASDVVELGSRRPIGVIGAKSKISRRMLGEKVPADGGAKPALVEEPAAEPEEPADEPPASQPASDKSDE